MTGGFTKGQLIVIAGRPAMGKSALALNIGWYAAKKLGLPVYYFSFEMTGEELTLRLAASVASIDSAILKTGKISETQWEPLSKAIREISESGLHFCDDVDITAHEIRGDLRRAIAETGQEPGLIIVDYLQLQAGSNEDDENQYHKVTKASRELKKLAVALKVPVIALSQLNRSVEGRQNKRPNLSDLRDSGAIEQDADIVMLLYRDEYYNPSSPDRGLAEINIAKQRSGATGTIGLLFEPQFTRFLNLAR
jgi:replicative DNA helicase